VQAVLVAAQVTVALTLLTGAALMTRTVGRLLEVDLGLDPAGVVVADLALGARPSLERRQTFLAAAERAAAIPGVRASGLISQLPLRDLAGQGPVHREELPAVSDVEAPFAYFRVVTPGLFGALAIDLRAGRGFTAGDTDEVEDVVVVSEALASTLWPGEDPLGRRIASVGWEGDVWATVVGVVEDVRLDGPVAEPGGVFYRPLAQTRAPTDMVVVARGASHTPGPFVAALRPLVSSLDPLAALHRAAAMEDVLDGAIRQQLRLRFFLSLLGALALVLGAVGVFGVVSYAVGRRTREYGVRVALGADPSGLVRAETRRGLVPVGVGVLVGIPASLAAARALGSFLFDVAPVDPLSLGVAAFIMLLAGVSAAGVPAIRAGRVDAVRSLKAD
jgi:predicted permease